MGWVVRKIAHMTEYALLYILTFRVLSLYIPTNRVWKLSVMFCLIHASLDEYHQTYIPGRTGTVKDIGIDMLGVMIGLGLQQVLSFKNRYEQLTRKHVE